MTKRIEKIGDVQLHFTPTWDVDRWQRLVVPEPLSGMLAPLVHGECKSEDFFFTRYNVPASVLEVCGWCRAVVATCTLADGEEFRTEWEINSEGIVIAHLAKLHDPCPEFTLAWKDVPQDEDK